MKRRVLLSVVCALLLSAVNAQKLLNEGFEGSVFPPSGWSVIDDQQPGSHFHWTIIEDEKSAISGSKSARVECGGYTYDEPIKEEWLITPALQLTNDSYKLEFKWVGASAAAIEKQEYDFKVKVSTDDGKTWTEIWSFLNKDQVEESGVKYPWIGWAKNTSLIDLTAYKGQTIKIAFIHCKLKAGMGVGNDIKIDDVVVEKYSPILNPQIESATRSYAFPASYIGAKKYSEVLSFKNVGNGVLTVTALKGLDGTDFSTTIVPAEVSLKKNEEYQFQLIYEPTVKGAPSATLTVETNGGTPLEIKLSGSKSLVPEGYTYEGFEGKVFPPVGWKITSKGTLSSSWSSFNYGLSGDKSARVGICEEGSLITPRLDLSGDQDYTIRFNYFEQYEAQTDNANGPENYFRLYLSKDGGITWNKLAFDATTLNEIVHKEINLGHPGNNCYLKWSYEFPGLDLSGGYDEIPEYSDIFLDDIILPPLYGSNEAPSATTLISPEDGATDIYNKEIMLSWNGVLFATNYKVYVGTTTDNFDLVNGEDVGDKTSYTIARADYAKTYYWKVVPYNKTGEATGVPVWSFTTMSDQSIKTFPYFEGFEAKTFPLGWNTTKEVYTKWDISNFNAFDGNGSAYISGSTDNTTGTLITPEFVLPSEKDIQITFYWGNRVPASLKKDMLGTQINNTTEANDIDALYFEIEDNGQWKTLAIMSDKDNEYWIRERVSLNEYKGKTVTFRWRFHVVNGGKSNGASLDNIKMELIGDECLAYFNKNEWNAGEVNYQRSFSSGKALSLTNGGEETLTVQDVKFTTSNYRTTLEAGTSIEANKSSVFSITFNAGTSATKIDDKMVVTFTNGQSVELPVSGTGLAQDILYFSFEEDEFASTSPKGLTTVDIDGLATVQPLLIYYPKYGTPFAYIVINQKAEPEGADWRNIYPHSGDQVLAAMCDQSHSSSTNDWIISPKMKASAESKFRFYAKSYGNIDQFHLHQVAVWVSTKTNTPSDFELVKGNITLPYSAEQAFTEFSIDLSKYAGQDIYVGLQHIADPDCFVAFFDDFYFEHFEIDASGISNQTTQQIRIYPNPVVDILYIDADDNSTVTVTSLAGNIISQEKDAKSIDMSSLPAGVYLVTVQNESKISTTRILKK